MTDILFKRKIYTVYIITNKYNTVLYTGMTNNINRRVFQHKNRIIDGFSKKYNLNKIVYFEKLNTLEEAIAREKQIKGGSRAKKIELIKKLNSEMKDLSDNFWGLLGKE